METEKLLWPHSVRYKTKIWVSALLLFKSVLFFLTKFHGNSQAAFCHLSQLHLAYFTRILGTMQKVFPALVSYVEVWRLEAFKGLTGTDLRLTVSLKVASRPTLITFQTKILLWLCLWLFSANLMYMTNHDTSFYARRNGKRYHLYQKLQRFISSRTPIDSTKRVPRSIPISFRLIHLAKRPANLIINFNLFQILQSAGPNLTTIIN